MFETVKLISNIDMRIEKAMNFYQTIASLVFCIMYTTAIFGAKKIYVPKSSCQTMDTSEVIFELIGDIPKVVFELIDKFNGPKSHYEETGDKQTKDEKGKAVSIHKVSTTEDTILYQGDFYDHDNGEYYNGQVTMQLSTMEILDR